MNFKKLTALGMGLVLTASVLAGCGSSDSKNTSADANNTSGDGATATESTESTESGNGEITDFTMFIAMPGSEINDGNEVQQIIAEKTGVRVKETWLTGQTAEEAVGTIIAGGEYPDFIDAGSGSTQMYEAGALVPLDDYIEKMKTEFDIEYVDIFTGLTYSRIIMVRTELQHIMMKLSGFSVRFLSGQDILKSRLLTSISRYWRIM